MSKPLVHDASDPKQVQRGAQVSSESRTDAKAALRAVLKTPDGRYALWNIMARCQVFTAGYVDDASRLYFKEGERNVGLWLLSEVEKADSQAYVTMQKEAAEREKTSG